MAALLDDVVQMRRLLAFTKTSLATPYPSPFGSSVVCTATGEVVAEAYDTVMRCNDPTNHGEVNAIRQACAALNSLCLRGYTVYSTCEPCPMCMSACVWAEVDAVVYGATFADATKYWPQPSTLGAEEVASRMCREPHIEVRHAVREECCQLFENCDAVRVTGALPLPPHR